MRLEEKNGLRILYPDYGCWIKNTVTGDIHTGRLFLGVNASIDIYEDVKNDTLSDELFIYLKSIKMKEDSLNKIGKIVANQIVDDTVALSISEFYDVWTSNRKYETGTYVQYKDVLYKIIQPHTSQDTWTPDVTSSLYSKVLVDPTGETILDWVQPDSTNGYMKGDKVRFNGIIYESVIDNNIWSPDSYPGGWKIIEG